jgi:hemoglobin-like flavoprotein
MTPRQMSLVQESFEQLKPTAAETGIYFYERLFTMEPSLRRMFRTAPAEQAVKLMQVLEVAVNSLQRVDQLVPVLEEMGAKHAAYGVVDAHYDTVGACLLATLAAAFGNGFTEEIRDAWATTYDLLAGAMKRGALATAAVSC